MCLQLYSFCWRYTARSKPISALSEVFIVDAMKQQRVVHVILIDSKPVTLSRCSTGILELPFDRDEYLKVPDTLGGGKCLSFCMLSFIQTLSLNSASVRLEIRRSKGRIRETRIQDPKDPSVELYVTDADFVDEPESKAPWVTFEFNFRDPSTNPDALDTLQELPNPLCSPVSSPSTQIQQSSQSEDSGTEPCTLFHCFSSSSKNACRIVLLSCLGSHQGGLLPAGILHLPITLLNLLRISLWVPNDLRCVPCNKRILAVC